MKFTNTLRTSLYTTVGALLLTLSSFAQAPEKMSYQAVIRAASNTLVTNQPVGMQISVLQGSKAVYEETQTPTSNTNGLVSLEIGTGTVISGSFTAIDWSAGTYFIKTETDPTGGTNYTITGTSQLLSVPYALYAKTSSDTAAVALNTDKVGISTEQTDAIVANTDKTGITTDQATEITANTAKTGIPSGGAEGQVLQIISGVPTWADATSPSYSIGDLVNGGVVFHLFVEGETGYVFGETHGLVVAMSDVGPSVKWGCFPDDLQNVPNVPVSGGVPFGLGAEIGDGISNTNAILNDCPTAPAALAARSLGAGWFLPSMNELKKIEDIKGDLEGVDGFTDFSNAYWSSSEHGNYYAWLQDFGDGVQDLYGKDSTSLVRAVRAF